MTDHDPQLELARRALQLRDQTNQRKKKEMTDELIRQLRDAGHDTAADQVRDAELAKQLDAAGHTGLAAQLTGEQAPAAPKNPVEAEGEEFIQELRDLQESSWTSAGKLIG